MENKEREKITGHSVYSPSQLPRIVKCPASVQESTYAPIPTTSSYALRGTFLHDIVPKAYKNGRGWLKKQQLPLNLSLDEYNWLNDCLDYIDMILISCSDHTDIFFENETDLKSWGLAEVWGTADVNIIDHQKNYIHVIDWKFGSGVQVYVENNEQLLAYGAGSTKYPSPYKTVKLHIVQPPLDHFDSWELTYDELTNWVFNVLEPAITEALGDSPRFNPGEKQCRWCPASITCRARHTSVLEGAKEIFKVYSNLTQVTKKELASVLRRTAEYQTYIKQIHKFVENELMHGREFPGKKLVAGKSNRKWDDPDGVEGWLSLNSGIQAEDMFTKKLISPAQAEKLDRALKKDAEFKKLVVKPEGAPKVVDEDDKRPAISPSKDATSAFEDSV